MSTKKPKRKSKAESQTPKVRKKYVSKTGERPLKRKVQRRQAKQANKVMKNVLGSSDHMCTLLLATLNSAGFFTRIYLCIQLMFKRLK